MPSFKRQRTDHDVVTTADVTDLTADSDNEESPLALTPRGVTSPPQDILPECRWTEGRLTQGDGNRGRGWRGGRWSGGGRRRGGRCRGRGEKKISDFVTSVQRSGTNDPRVEASWGTPHSGNYGERHTRFVSSTESSLPPLQPQEPRKRLQIHSTMSSDTRCTVATMKYTRQHPSVGGGSTDMVTGRDAPNMRKTRSFEQRNTGHSDNSCDDVFVIEPPPVQTHSPYFAKTTGSPKKTANHIGRSSGGDFDQLWHCRTSLPPPRTTAGQETHTGAQFTDRCLGLDDDIVNLSSSPRGAKLNDASSVSSLSQDREERRSIEDYSPVERVCYAHQNKQPRAKVKDDHEVWVASNLDSAGCKSDVVWVGCEREEGSSGERGVSVQSSDALRRDPLRSSGTVAVSQSTNNVCPSACNSVCPSACNTPTSALASLRKHSDGFVASSKRSFLPAGGPGDRSHTVREDRQMDDCISFSPGSQSHSPSTRDKNVSVTGRLREEGKRRGLRSSLSDCDVSVIGDKSAESDDDFEEPKKRRINRFAVSGKKEKKSNFSWKSDASSSATPTATPTHPPKKKVKEASSPSSRPKASSPSSKPKAEQLSVFQHLQNSPWQKPSPLRSLPPPLLSSNSRSRTSSSEDEVCNSEFSSSRLLPSLSVAGDEPGDK